ANVWMTSGETRLLAFGRYLVHPRTSGGWLRELVEKPREIVVAENSPPVVDIVVPGEFAELEIEPSYAGDRLLGVLIVDLTDEDGIGLAIANWEPARGPIRLPAPCDKNIRLTIASVAYEPFERSFVIPATQERMVVEAPLQERPPQRR